MANLIGLPGVKGGTIRDVQFSSSVTGAMKLLTTERAATGAGDHGAWMVWKDDDGAWRCMFMRSWSTIDSVTVNTKTAVRAWLREWLPRVDQRDKP